MKKVLLFVLLGIIAACNVDNNCSPEEFHATIASEKEISEILSQSFPQSILSIVDGNELVFSYNHVGYQCDDALDDEWGEELFFQLDPSLTEFDWIDEQIEASHCFYRQYGAWVNHEQVRINKGRIQGTKISGNRWNINVDIEVYYSNINTPVLIQFKRVFTLD